MVRIHWAAKMSTRDTVVKKEREREKKEDNVEGQ